MPTRYGAPERAMRTAPHRQPPAGFVSLIVPSMNLGRGRASSTAAVASASSIPDLWSQDDTEGDLAAQIRHLEAGRSEPERVGVFAEGPAPREVVERMDRQPRLCARLHDQQAALRIDEELGGRGELDRGCELPASVA